MKRSNRGLLRLFAHHHGQLAHCGAGSDGVRAFLNQVCRVQPEDVHAHYLFGLLVEEDLPPEYTERKQVDTP